MVNSGSGRERGSMNAPEHAIRTSPWLIGVRDPKRAAGCPCLPAILQQPNHLIFQSPAALVTISLGSVHWHALGYGYYGGQVTVISRKAIIS